MNETLRKLRAISLASALVDTIDTNGVAIITRLMDFAEVDGTNSAVGWEAHNFAKAAIAMLDQHLADKTTQVMSDDEGDMDDISPVSGYQPH